MSDNIQSAEEFLREWFNEYASEEPSGLCDPNWQELMARIEARDAAQRDRAILEATVERVCKHCGLSSSPCLEKCEIVKVILGLEAAK